MKGREHPGGDASPKYSRGLHRELTLKVTATKISIRAHIIFLLLFGENRERKKKEVREQNTQGGLEPVTLMLPVGLNAY